MRYYWDTIVECVPPETILEVLRASGFVGVGRRVRAGVFSEYVGVKPTR
jgi:demethylmenaquinone methyltransferase/2-methoxy-6-polyprenyl-1,4-benzoquinol methylase